MNTLNRIVAAATLARTNFGFDLPSAEQVAQAARLCQHLDGAVDAICGEFYEGDDARDDFYREAEGWLSAFTCYSDEQLFGEWKTLSRLRDALCVKKITADERRNSMFESLDGMAVLILRDYENGNKSDARMRFNSCLVNRKAYLAYTLVGLHVSNGGAASDLDQFFRSVTP